jgi:protein FAM50
MTENLDERLKKSTIGLVTLSDFQKTKDELEEQQRQLAAKTLSDKALVGWAACAESAYLSQWINS